MDYIEYSIRGKCNVCGDPLWVINNIESVVCKCGNASISNGLSNNAVVLSDQEMIDYLTLEGYENIKLIKL